MKSCIWFAYLVAFITTMIINWILYLYGEPRTVWLVNLFKGWFL